MPLQLVLILFGAVLIAIAAHSAPALVEIAGLAALAASMLLFTRLLPRAEEPPFEDYLARETTSERANQLTAYALTLFIAAVVLLVSLWWPAPAIVLSAMTAAWVILWWPGSMRTGILTTAIDIRREPADVFAFVSDQRNLLRYWPYYESVEMLTPEPVGAGTRFQARGQFPKGFLGKEPVAFGGIEEILRFEPPARLASRLNRPRPNLDEFTFEPVPGGTRLTHSFTFQSSYSSAVLGGEFFRAKAHRLMNATRKVAWARAKEILESESA